MRFVGAMQTRTQDDNRSIGGDSDTDLWADVDEKNRRMQSGTIDSSDPASSTKVEVSRPVRDFQIERPLASEPDLALS